jgi:hypothetical protein
MLITLLMYTTFSPIKAQRSDACLAGIVQTPLNRFVANLLWVCCTTSCTTCRKLLDLLLYSFSSCCRPTAFRVVVGLQLFDLLWTGRKPYSIDSICCGFVVESTTNPQHLDMSRCYGFVVDLLYMLLYNKSTTNRTSGV